MAPPTDVKGDDVPVVEASPVHISEERGRSINATDPSFSASGRVRNCCDNRGCLYTFWIVVGMFLVASLVVGLVTNRPWLGALGLLSIGPAVCILYFVYWKNHHHLVKLPRVVNMFCWGIVGAIPCAFLELLLTYLFTWITGFKAEGLSDRKEPVGHVIISALFAAFFVAALCEESLKYYLVVEYPNGIKQVKTAYSIVILSTAGALGFATLENIGYIFQDSTQSSLAVAIMRALLAVPLHAATGIIIGLNIAKALMERNRPSYWKTLWLPILLHGSYDGLLMLTLGLKREGPLVGDLGIIAFFIPICALIYGIRSIWKLPLEYFALDSTENQRLLG